MNSFSSDDKPQDLLSAKADVQDCPKTTFSFVTALYSIQPGYEQELFSRFHRLLTFIPPHSPIYVWTDLDIPEEHMADLDVHVIILKSPLEDFEVYKASQKQGLQLPSVRCPVKDTAAFMGLMNTKIEMVARAPVKDGYVAWIDCGICKIFRSEDQVRFQLDQITQKNWVKDKWILPGCWQPRIPSRDHICWRFCGGFFVISTEHRKVAYTMFKMVFDDIVEFENRMMWEVNVWAEMEQNFKHLFAWYPGDHNDSIFHISDSLLLPY